MDNIFNKLQEAVDTYNEMHRKFVEDQELLNQQLGRVQALDELYKELLVEESKAKGEEEKVELKKPHTTRKAVSA